jgi:hypothetical protein
MNVINNSKNDNNNNTNKIYNRNDKKVSAIADSLLRISILKLIPFENEYIIKEVSKILIECILSKNLFKTFFFVKFRK